MRFETWSPPQPYDRFIETFWYWEGDVPSEHLKETILASGQMGLLVNLTDDVLSWYDGIDLFQARQMRGIGLAGPYARAIAVDAYHEKMMGVQFRPGGAFPFFHSPLNAFANRHTALQDLWGADAVRLHNQLAEAPTSGAAFRILFHALVERSAGQLEPDPAVSHALPILERGLPGVSIGSIVRATGLSPQRFIKIFSDQVGLKPKTFQRISRFRRTMGQIANLAEVDWSDAAELNGYYDQSHFIREFRQFSSLSPSEYLLRRGPHLQHVPMPD